MAIRAGGLPDSAKMNFFEIFWRKCVGNVAVRQNPTIEDTPIENPSKPYKPFIP